MYKYIVNDGSGGLCGRIKSLISILRLGKALNRIPLLYWPKDTYLKCDFDRLFDLKLIQKKTKLKIIDNKQLKDIKKSNCAIYRHLLDNLLVKNKYLIITTARLLTLPNEIPLGFAKIFPTEKGNNIDLEFKRIPVRVREDISCYFSLLKPKKEIQKKIDYFSKRYNLKNRIGIHIRRLGVATEDKHYKTNISSDNSFIKEIKVILNRNPNERFFLATDDFETEKKFKRIFKNKIVSFHKKSVFNFKENSIMEALVDLMLLSKTKLILGSYISTFSELAWWFGGCKADFKIVGIEKNKLVRKELKEIKKPKNKILIPLKFILKKAPSFVWKRLAKISI